MQKLHKKFHTCSNTLERQKYTSKKNIVKIPSLFCLKIIYNTKQKPWTKNKTLKTHRTRRESTGTKHKTVSIGLSKKLRLRRRKVVLYHFCKPETGISTCASLGVSKLFYARKSTCVYENLLWHHIISDVLGVKWVINVIEREERVLEQIHPQIERRTHTRASRLRAWRNRSINRMGDERRACEYVDNLLATVCVGA